MHPMTIMAVAREIEDDRQRGRHKVQLRSVALTNRAQRFDGSSAAGGFARRLLTGISLRLGAAFAEMEMRVVLRCVLRTRTLRAASADAERPTRRNVTLSPRHGTRIIIAPRPRNAARTPTRITC